MEAKIKESNDNEEQVVFIESCGNIFKDLDLPDHEILLHRAKRELNKRRKRDREKEK